MQGNKNGPSLFKSQHNNFPSGDHIKYFINLFLLPDHLKPPFPFIKVPRITANVSEVLTWIRNLSGESWKLRENHQYSVGIVTVWKMRITRISELLRLYHFVFQVYRINWLSTLLSTFCGFGLCIVLYKALNR